MDFKKHSIEQSLITLLGGGIMLYPTDTIWGIGCDATHSSAILKIYELKKREEKKSMILLVSDENMVEEYVLNPSGRILDYLSHQNRPTTAIYENAINLPDILINPDKTIAIRITTDDFCKSLIRQFGKPLISTSANISGEPYPQVFSQISDDIKKGVDYIVQHRQNDRSSSKPSSIIKLNGNNEIEVIR
ncbi:MAG: L-threonylcarbamoyladenylate synthase [Ginsengibacter sp.]